VTPVSQPDQPDQPDRPVERFEDEDAATQVRDLGSASRSCLVIIGILLALVLFACVALVVRAVIGG
jgi:hypothetical protein